VCVYVCVHVYVCVSSGNLCNVHPVACVALKSPVLLKQVRGD
jgi:hypothetical protein